MKFILEHVDMALENEDGESQVNELSFDIKNLNVDSFMKSNNADKLFELVSEVETNHHVTLDYTGTPDSVGYSFYELPTDKVQTLVGIFHNFFVSHKYTVGKCTTKRIM